MGTETKEAHDQSIETWSHNDGLLTSWLLGLMTKEVMLLLDGTETAYDVWNSLGEKLIPMTKEKEKGTRSLDEYLREFKGICDALAAVRKPVSDLDKVFQLAQGLGTKYMDFRVAMLSKPPYLSYNQFVLALQGYEQMIMTENEENKELINMNKPILPNEEEEEIKEEDFFLEVMASLQQDDSITMLLIPQALAAMTLNEEEKDLNFYVDSGTTTHITNDPEIKKNLLSIGQLTSDNPCFIEFSSTGFVIKDQLQQVLARGTKKGGLYALKENVIQAMTIPIEMVSFSTPDASCETSKIDHQTKSWKENTANQSSNSKKCNHCPCTTEQRNQFSVEGRISASCNTNQNTEASCVNSIGTPTTLATEISIVAASTNDHNTVITTKTPTDVALGQHTDNKGTHMITKSKLKNDPSLKSQMVTFAAIRSDISELKTYRTTLKIPYWLKAMQEEIKTLNKNRTWDLVPRPPTTNIVGSKWVFKTKLKEDGTIDRYKAQLVAQGFSQIQGLEFGETFSPVIKHTTIRLILSLAVTLGWKMRQLDVKNAFLHGFLKEEVFMEQPLGFINEDLPNHVYKLNRSLYGLKQVPRA
uniref:Reverse transcriptase Ty1/copia-type domain-containing protein n=2 Tax=Vitis vinifera TaxID=29760 RepID=A5BKK9_VITVI|nr:hypothetical protein VITISV_021483 [Vitis vinifera]